MTWRRKGATRSFPLSHALPETPLRPPFARPHPFLSVLCSPSPPPHTRPCRPCTNPPPDASHKRLGGAGDELRGQGALFKEAKGALRDLERQARREK